MNASSDAARTSRVSAPIARPSAAKASAPRPPRRPRAGSAPSPGPRTGPSPASIRRQTASEQTAASPAFSSSRPVRDTRPRTSREKAFSSRSSASVPAASSSVMNMSETATASATANELSEVRAAVERARPHPHRLADHGEHVVREREVLARQLGEGDHPVDLARARASPAGSSARACARISSDSLEAEHVEVLAEEAVLAAVADQLQQLQRLLGHALGERRVGLLHLRLDRVLHELALGRVLGVVEDLHGARLEPRLEVRRSGPRG